MINGIPVIAIIPARGGSTRLSRKNLKEILPGVSLLDYAVARLSKTKFVDEIVITTEDAEILDKAFNHSLRKIGGKIVVAHHRDPEFAKDDTLIMEVVRHVYASYKRGLVCYLLVHQMDLPLTRPEDFDAAVEKLANDDDAAVCISVNPDGHQNGSIRVVKPHVMEKKCLEYVITTYRNLYPQIDIHTEGDLAEAQVQVDILENGAK